MELKGLGYLPDVPKHEDYTELHADVVPLLTKTRLASRVVPPPNPKGKGTVTAPPVKALPAKVDLRTWFSPIEDQGYIGSCTANAAVGLLEYFERKAKGKHVNASRLFVYKASRNLLGWTGDTGAYLRTAMQALVLFGAPPEAFLPYDGAPPATNTHFDEEPSAFCYAFGSNYQAMKYFRLDPNGAAPSQVLGNIRAFLAGGFPSMFGFPVYSEFDNLLPGGLVAPPGPGSHYRGGHAIVAAGYDDNLMIGPDKGALLIRNSWGPGWGNSGYAWMSYRYVSDGLAVNWWTMISAEWVNTGQF